MHSSRMRTARSLTMGVGGVSFRGRGVRAQGGVPAQGGMYLPKWDVPAQGGVPARGGAPAQVLPPVDRILDTRY